MQHADWTMPPLLKELHQIEFDYADGEGVDFEPYSEFLSEKETRAWIQAWTGNKQLDGAEYRVFGQDGTGGYAAFWCVRPDGGLLDQPIVFFGSEGELGVVAADFADYLWLLAGGLGPYEAVAYPEIEREANPSFIAFARRYATSAQRKPREVLANAQREFPAFVEGVQAACQHK
jgi:hypothetical protein